MKNRLKHLTPKPIWQVFSTSYWWWHNRGRHELAKAFHPDWRRSVQAVRNYKNQHKGERCFILGNGPSLRHTDLRRLKEETTFGLNRIYLTFPEMGFPTTYYVAINTLVIEQCASDIVALPIPKFISWRARPWIKAATQTHFLDTDYTDPPNFSGTATGRLFEGSTVTYVALQLAYYMGFEEVILIGVDHSFTTQGSANQIVVSEGEDPNHFDPGYFGKGFRWQLPDLEGSERAYRMANQAYVEAGRRVLDATIGGKLTVFPKVDFDSLFSSP